jgi:nickel/cobalt transporter (NicO) family protein
VDRVARGAPAAAEATVNDSLFVTLAAAAVTVGSLHSLAPDHWIPIAAVARARDWSGRRTARVALVCGFGHVTVSVLLGLIGLVSGVALVQSLGNRAAAVSGVLLIGFGVAYALWGMRHMIVRRLHGHDHTHYDHVHDPERTTVGALFAIYCADPCVAVVPILFAAAPLSRVETLTLVVLYEAATIATMVGLTAVARAGASVLRARWLERYGDSAAGGLIVLTGVAVAVLGW